MRRNERKGLQMFPMLKPFVIMLQIKGLKNFSNLNKSKILFLNVRRQQTTTGLKILLQDESIKLQETVLLNYFKARLNC
jgi:hypothetical protein